MSLNRVVVGLLEANCYILIKEDYVIVIDPGDDYDKIKPFISDKKVLAVLVTHHHSDHIGALNCFDKSLALSYYNLKEREYKIGPFTFSVIYTPGHTSDSVSYYFPDDGMMFTGDFLFKGTIGRFDFESSSEDEMIYSLMKVKDYPNVKIFPGHGDFTTLSFEKENNIYFKCVL